MSPFFHIIKYKLYSNIKTTLDPRFSSVLRNLVSLLVYIGFAYGAYQFAYVVTFFMMQKTFASLYLFHIFVSMILFVFFIAVNLGNIIVSYSTLYRSQEVEFLLCKPVDFKYIFLIKFFDNFFYSSTILLLGALMVLLGYGRYFYYPWYYFVLILIFVLIPFMFLSACLAVLILMAIMKLASRIGFRKVLAGIFVLYGAITYIFFSYTGPLTVVEKLHHYYPNIDKYLVQATPTFLKYLPNQWVSMILYYVDIGKINLALPYLFILLLITTALFLITILIADKFYYRSWLISLHIKSTGLEPYNVKKVHFIDFRLRSILPPQTEVIIKKEVFTFFREASQWIHLLIMVMLTGIFSISISHLNLRFRLHDLQLITYLIIFSFGGFMVSALALRFVFPMIGLEGKAFWALKSSPVKERKILWIKFLMGFLPILIMAEYIGVSSNIPFVKSTAMQPLLLWLGIISAFCISLVTVSLNLGLGGYFANYLERNPIRVASSQGATITFLLSILYLFILTVIFISPVSVYFEKFYTAGHFNVKIIIFPITLIILVSFILFIVGIRIGFKSISKDF